MAMNSANSPSVFGVVLRQCRLAAKLSCDELAGDLIHQGFPSSQYSGHVTGSAADQTWLAKTIERIEKSVLTDLWPFSDDATEFIDPAAHALHKAFEPLQRLTLAMALDVLGRADLPQP